MGVSPYVLPFAPRPCQNEVNANEYWYRDEDPGPAMWREWRSVPLHGQVLPQELWLIHRVLSQALPVLWHIGFPSAWADAKDLVSGL